MNIVISRTCDPAFGRVREALEWNFADGGKVGEAVSVYLAQRKMVSVGGPSERCS